jgi:hypothetical protein
VTVVYEQKHRGSNRRVESSQSNTLACKRPNKSTTRPSTSDVRRVASRNPCSHMPGAHMSTAHFVPGLSGITRWRPTAPASQAKTPSPHGTPTFRCCTERPVRSIRQITTHRCARCIPELFHDIVVLIEHQQMRMRAPHVLQRRRGYACRSDVPDGEFGTLNFMFGIFGISLSTKSLI